MRRRPSFLGPLPPTPQPDYLATIWSRHPGRDSRGMISVVGRSEDDLNNRIVEEIGNIRSRGHIPIKTEITIDGSEWVYEYDSTGHIERVFKDGEITP